jgi:hypothetical protein
MLKLNLFLSLGNRSRITSAICISGPFDFIACVRLFEKLSVRAYSQSEYLVQRI